MAGRLRRVLVPAQRGQMTVPAPMQCSQLPVKISVHTDWTLLKAMLKDATCGGARPRTVIGSGCFQFV